MTFIGDARTQANWGRDKADLIEQIAEFDTGATMQVHPQEDLVLDVDGLDAAIGIYDNADFVVTVIGSDVYGWSDDGEVHLVGSGYIAPGAGVVHLYGDCRFDDRYLQHEGNVEWAGLGQIVRHNEAMPEHLR